MYLQTEPNNKYGNRFVLFAFIVIFILCCVAFLSGCDTPKHIRKICASCPHTDSVTITKRDTVIVRDTTVFLSVFGDTIQIPCPETKPFDIIKKLNGVKTEVRSNGKTVECICSDDSLKFVIAKIRSDHFAEIDSLRIEKIPELKPCEETWWQTLYRVGFWIFFSCFILVVIGLIYHLVVSMKI